MSTSAWGNVHPSQLMGPGTCFKKYDLHTVTIDELKVRELKAAQGCSSRGRGWVGPCWGS
jgi:hypothetical protein